MKGIMIMIVVLIFLYMVGQVAEVASGGMSRAAIALDALEGEEQ